MTQRLPSPGSDNGTWGYVLNGFLGVAHDSGGNLLPAAVTAAGGILASNNLSELQSAAVARTNLGLGSASTLSSSALLQAANNLSELSSVTTARTNLGAAQGLVPTSVKTNANSPYVANPGDFVPVDLSSGNVTVTLPTAPADKTRVEIKVIALSGSYTATIATGGSDVLNKAAGATTASLSLLNQATTLQYASSSSIWYVQGDDLPLSGLTSSFIPASTLSSLATTASVTAIAPSTLGTYRAKQDGGCQFNAILLPTAGTISSTSAPYTLTVTGASFTAADVGKTICVLGGPNSTSVSGSTPTQNQTLPATASGTTISSVTNATTVVLSAQPNATVSNADVVYGTDDSTALTAAITYAAANSLTLEMPPGGTILSAELPFPSYFTLQGQGIDRTTLYPTLIGLAAIHTTASSSSNLTMFPIIRDFTIDGRFQYANPANYNVNTKGINMTWTYGGVMERVKAQYVAATGLAWDFLSGNGRMYGCQMICCGRAAASAGTAGGAGIGNASGNSLYEQWTIDSCYASGCATNGIFTENQQTSAASQSYGGRIVNCFTENTVYGPGIAEGANNTVVANCWSMNNAGGNFVVNSGTLNRQPGQATSFADCVSFYSYNPVSTTNGYGYLVDATYYSISRVSFDNCKAFAVTGGYGGTGFSLRTGGNTISDVSFTGCKTWYNKLDGFQLGVPSGTGTLSYITLDGCTSMSNGQTSSTTAGYNINLTIDHLRMINCNANDSQGTQTQKYGLRLAASQSLTNSTLDTCDFSNNLTLPLDLVGTFATTSTVRKVKGYNPVGAVTVAVPATTVPTTALVYDSIFYVTAGTTSCSVVVSGVAAGPTITVPANSLVAVTVPAGYTVTPTYTNAPTWVVYQN